MPGPILLVLLLKKIISIEINMETKDLKVSSYIDVFNCIILLDKSKQYIFRVLAVLTVQNTLETQSKNISMWE